MLSTLSNPHHPDDYDLLTEGPVVHERLLGEGRHPAELAPDDEHGQQVNGGLVVGHYHAGLLPLQELHLARRMKEGEEARKGVILY